MDRFLKEAIYDFIKVGITYSNYGLRRHHNPADSSLRKLSDAKIRVLNYDNKDVILQDDEPIYKIERRYASRKVTGNYKELLPILRSLRPEWPDVRP